MPVGKWPVGGCMTKLDSKTKVGGLPCLPGVYFAQKGGTRLLWGGRIQTVSVPAGWLFSPCLLRRAKSLCSPV